MRFFILLITLLFFGNTFSQEKLVQQTINKNIKMLTPTSIYKVNAIQALGTFGNDIAPKAAFVGQGERTTLTVSEVYDTVGFFQPGYKKKRKIERDITIEKSFFRSSITRAYASKLTFYQDEVKNINGRDMIIFEFEGEQELTGTNGEPYKRRFYRYLQYCFVKNRKYIFNFQCPASQRNYWQKPMREIMESIKITK